MLHEGKVILNVSGAERQGLDIHDLLRISERTLGEALSDDALLLS